MKILFATNRNIFNTCGELRLIKNRTVALHEEYGIDTDFLLFRSDKCQNKPQEEIGANSTLHLFLYADKNVFSLIRRWKQLKKQILNSLKNNVYEAVILSGNLVFSLAKIIKKRYPNVKVIFDVHGAIEELIEFKGNGKLSAIKRKCIYKAFKHVEKKYMKYMDGAFVVSEALKEYLIKEYKLENQQFFLVPCAQKKTVIDTTKKQENRKRYRKHYQIKEDETLFIYSGGLSPWQCVDEAVTLFKKLKEGKAGCKMLLLTGDSKAVEKYANDDITVDSVEYSLVNDVLCAGDYAFLLRGNFITNKVAYPNKFIEYVSSGMKIIATPFVCDVAKQIQTHDVGFIYEDDVDGLEGYVNDKKEYLTDVDNRQNLLDDVCFENRLKPFIHFIRGDK